MGGPSTVEESTPNCESLRLLAAPFLPPWQNALQERPSDITESICLPRTDGETKAQERKGLAQSQGMG